MASCTVLETREETNVGMGKIAAGRGEARLRAVLGSCVGIGLYHPRFQAGVFAHVVLPDAAGRNAPPGKFADTAVPEMLRMLGKLGVSREGVVAKIAGGAAMFGHGGPVQIGQNNIQAVTKELRSARIPIVGEDVGGKSGRRVTFDCANGTYTVEIVGQPPKTL